MANQRQIPTSIIAALLLLFLSLHSRSVFSSSDPPASSPSPAPVSGADSPSAALSNAPANSPASPVPISDISSSPSPSPPPSNAPSPKPVKNSPSPSQPPESDSPVQSPAPASVADHAGVVADEHVQKESSDGGGMNSGKKAGIAVGVLIGACAVGLAGFVYKKRQDNVRRSQYGYDARSSMI